jgi:hypothetical protein
MVPMMPSPVPFGDFGGAKCGTLSSIHPQVSDFTQMISGEGGIRTHGGVTPTPVFETGLFNRSSTSPASGRNGYSSLSERDL